MVPPLMAMHVFMYFQFSSLWPCVVFTLLTFLLETPGPYSSNEDAGSGGDVFAHVTWRVVTLFQTHNWGLRTIMVWRREEIQQTFSNKVRESTDLTWYIDFFKSLRTRIPTFWLQFLGFSWLEVAFFRSLQVESWDCWGLSTLLPYPSVPAWPTDRRWLFTFVVIAVYIYTYTYIHIYIYIAMNSVQDMLLAAFSTICLLKIELNHRKLMLLKGLLDY